MEYSPELLHKVQQTELAILQDVKKVCANNNITYFAIGGTNLGALRHDGFIPWDDDIDIAMMRDDYEKFLQVAPKELPPDLVVQHFSTDQNAAVYFIKVRRDGTKFVEPGRKNKRMHQGIFIDIMPFDFVTTDEKELVTYRRMARFWKELYIAKNVAVITADCSPIVRVFASIYRLLLHVLLIPVSKKWLFNKYDQHIQKFNKTCRGHVSSRGEQVNEWAYDDIFPVRTHPFENTEINVPGKAEKVLTIQFGDWKQLPPEGQRVNHMPLEVSV